MVKLTKNGFIKGFNGKYNDPNYIKKQSEAKLGELNSNYKGADNYWNQRKIYVPLAKSLKQCCSLCETTDKLVTHHIDFNFRNNKLSNRLGKREEF